MREKIIEEKLTKAVQQNGVFAGNSRLPELLAYLTGFYYCPAADLLSWK